MSAFDETLTKVIAAVAAVPCYPTLAGVTVIRDLKGRIRLLLEFNANAQEQDDLPPDWAAQKASLQNRLNADLGVYWGGVIWRGRERKDAVYLATAEELRNVRQPWSDPAQPQLNPVPWFKLERQFSKSSWGAVAGPSWPIGDAAKPAIVAFYSFKGGVGRTVALSAVALLLAQAGHNVVVIDLDIEAPGVAPFLMGTTPLKDDGVVDYLVEWQLTETRPATLDPFVSIQTEPALVNANPIRVIGSGKVNGSFVEKVARLDFEGYIDSQKNPMSELLQQIAGEYDPAFILLDVRSGLHDLGGLSLNVLSHLNVIFSRDSAQAWSGLETVLSILGEHNSAGHGSELFVVHSMVPPKDRDKDAHERFVTRSYTAFEEHYFGDNEQMPDIGSNEAPYGLPILFQESLQNATDAARLQPTTDSGGAYIELAKRIGAFLGRNTI